MSPYVETSNNGDCNTHIAGPVRLAKMPVADRIRPLRERRIGRTNRYILTPDGIKVAVFYPQVSGRGESHPPALAEPGVRVSPHRAPTGRPWVRAMRCQWTKSLGWR